jgi:prevent-host-death family protein
MTRTVSISVAKSHLSELVGRTMYAGDHIVVERHGKAVAVIVPVEDYAELEKARREKEGRAQDRRQQTFPGISPR